MKNIDYDALDPSTRNIAKYFNTHGLAVLSSCDGTPAHKLFWVQFDKSVTEAGIRMFMDERTVNHGAFTARGWFVKRFENYHEDGQFAEMSCMCYVAADHLSAERDLRDWLKMDMERLDDKAKQKILERIGKKHDRERENERGTEEEDHGSRT